MRLLHVYSGNLFGGVESVLVALARTNVPGVTHEFALAFEGRASRELAAAGAAVHPLGAVRASRPHTIARARRSLDAIVRGGAFDAALCHAAWSYAIFAPVVRRAGVPSIFWAHDVLTRRHWTEKWASRTPPDLVVANSEYTAASIDAVFPGADRRVVYAPVDVAPRAISAAHRAELRASLSTADRDVVIVTACRSEAWKGHLVLADALGMLGGLPGWTWWQAGGEQRPSERALLDAVRERAARGGISGRVRMLGNRSDVPDLLAASDVHCQPNTSAEPFGVVFVEALAAGLPSVTTGLGGVAEIVDPTCGVVVPPSDPAALASALRTLIADPIARRQLGAAGPPRARRLCDPAAQTRRLADAIDSLRGMRVTA